MHARFRGAGAGPTLWPDCTGISQGSQCMRDGQVRDWGRQILELGKMGTASTGA